MDHHLLDLIQYNFDSTITPIEIDKELSGGLSGAEIYIVQYSQSKLLGILKIDEINEYDVIKRAIDCAKSNLYESSIAGLVQFCELKEEDGTKKFAYLYELVGDSLNDIKTFFRLVKNESGRLGAITEEIVDFVFNWNKKHHSVVMTPYEAVKNCLGYRLNDQKYVNRFEESLNIPVPCQYIYVEEATVFLPNPLYFLKDDEAWKEQSGRAVSVNVLQAMAHGDFHSKNVIVSQLGIHVIDIGQAQEDINLFYDLLYFEFYTYLDLLDLNDPDQMIWWAKICFELSENIDKVKIPDGPRASILREFTNGLRQGYRKVIADPRNTRFDSSFYLAGVAVALGFLRKTNDVTKQKAALLYSGYFLRKVLENCNLFMPTIRDAVSINLFDQYKSKKTINIEYSFVGMGQTVSHHHENEQLRIVPNRIFLDTGNKLTLGAIDLHKYEDGYLYQNRVYHSTTGVITCSPNYVLDQLKDPKSVEIIVHSEPDFDCFASAYLTRELILNGKLPKHHQKLAEYVEKVDQGLVQHSDSYVYTPYAIAHAIYESIRLENTNLTPDEYNQKVLARGMELIEFLISRLDELAGENRDLFNPAILYEGCPFDKEFSLIEEDYQKFLADVNNLCERTSLLLPLVDNNKEESKLVKALQWKSPPTCLLHKYWARRAGYTLTFIPIYSKRKIIIDKEFAVNRVIISVDPTSDVCLSQLGQQLEQEECKKELELLGDAHSTWRDRGSRRFQEEWCTNNDPWYDGRAFNYTIVDTPRTGSLLSIEEMKDIMEGYFLKVSKGEVVGQTEE
ncbi:hypothetical protein [Ferdinandcohnia sp. Marseille-Q9671]